MANLDLDLTGQLPANQVVGEVRSFVELNDRLFVPTKGTFYQNGFEIKNSDTDDVLLPGIDYKLLHLHLEATKAAAKSAFQVIYVINRNITSVTLGYHAAGGRFEGVTQALQELIDLAVLSDLDTVQWGAVLGKPEQFDPNLHRHPGDDFASWGDVIRAIASIKDALIAGDKLAIKSIYDYIRYYVELNASTGSTGVTLEQTDERYMLIAQINDLVNGINLRHNQLNNSTSQNIQRIDQVNGSQGNTLSSHNNRLTTLENQSGSTYDDQDIYRLINNLSNTLNTFINQNWQTFIDNNVRYATSTLKGVVKLTGTDVIARSDRILAATPKYVNDRIDLATQDKYSDTNRQKPKMVKQLFNGFVGSGSFTLSGSLLDYDFIYFYMSQDDQYSQAICIVPREGLTMKWSGNRAGEHIKYSVTFAGNFWTFSTNPTETNNLTVITDAGENCRIQRVEGWNY